MFEEVTRIYAVAPFGAALKSYENHPIIMPCFYLYHTVHAHLIHQETNHYPSHLSLISISSFLIKANESPVNFKTYAIREV